MIDQPMTPASNEEAEESKLVSLAFRQAERQLQDGTASSQVVTHFLKLGSRRAKVELTKLELEGRLIEEKIAAEKSGQHINELFTEVIEALKRYTYTPPGDPNADTF